MSNIAKRIALAVVFGLFTAGTPALAAGTGVQVTQGEKGAQGDQGVDVRLGAAAVPVAVVAQAELAGGTWRHLGSQDCGKGDGCSKTMTCEVDEKAISGICGDPGGDVFSIRVVYSGLGIGTGRSWQCVVENTSGQNKRNYEVGVYCVK